MGVRGPYLELLGVDPATCPESTLARAERELVAMAVATVASGREPSITDSGLLRFRGPKPHRLTLVVSPAEYNLSGEFLQAVWVDFRGYN